MQVTASWENGNIKLDQPLHLASNHARLLITVLDESDSPVEHSFAAENDNPQDSLIPTGLRAQVDAETRKYGAILNADYPPDDELPELNSKYEERLAAFELRAEMRREQGRPE